MSEAVSCKVYREKRVSKKSGSLYEVLVLQFSNGYKMDVFMNEEQKFILSGVPSVN